MFVFLLSEAKHENIQGSNRISEAISERLFVKESDLVTA